MNGRASVWMVFHMNVNGPTVLETLPVAQGQTDDQRPGRQTHTRSHLNIQSEDIPMLNPLVCRPHADEFKETCQIVKDYVACSHALGLRDVPSRCHSGSPPPLPLRPTECERTDSPYTPCMISDYSFRLTFIMDGSRQKRVRHNGLESD